MASSAYGFTLAAAAERLTLRLRNKVFRVIVAQDAWYFDASNHSRGVLTSHLATDPVDARGLFHGQLYTWTQATALIGVGCGIAFAYCPQMAGLMLGLMPFTAFSRRGGVGGGTGGLCGC